MELKSSSIAMPNHASLGECFKFSYVEPSIPITVTHDILCMHTMPELRAYCSWKTEIND